MNLLMKFHRAVPLELNRALNMNNPNPGGGPEIGNLNPVGMPPNRPLLTGHCPLSHRNYRQIKGSWSGFILKFERIAERHRWSKDKMLDRLFSSLTEKALEYAIKCKNNKTYDGLKQELKLRFDMTDEPMIARQKLVTAKQTDDETIEAYMQRILNIASDGYGEYDFKVMQQMAIEAFLRGCLFPGEIVHRPRGKKGF